MYFVASCAYSPFFHLFFAYLDSNKKRKAICLLDESQNIQGLNNFSAWKLQKSDLRNRIKADALDALLFLKANADHIDNLAKL